MKNKIFIFNFVEDILFFSPLLGNKLFFSKKSQPPPPPEYQMVHPLCSNKHVFKELSEYVSISIKSYIVFYAYDIIDLKNAVSIYFFRGGGPFFRQDP